MTKKAASSNSFVQNVFRGMVDPTQMFPYPVVLDLEQKENLEMLEPLDFRFLLSSMGLACRTVSMEGLPRWSVPMTWVWASSSLPISPSDLREF